MIIQCYWCGKDKEISKGEFKRQVKKGRNKFFCSLSCGGHYKNSIHNPPASIITKICPQCNKSFETKDIKRQPTFCSKSCASSGSMTNYRIQRAKETGQTNQRNFISSRDALKKREAWKYVKLEILLNSKNKQYEFEFTFVENESFIYDLALFAEKTIIEFDSKYHNEKGQKLKDEKKNQFAKNLGWKVIHISTGQNCVIEPECLEAYL